MKFSVTLLCILYSIASTAQSRITAATISPLAAFSAEWNEARYLNCNTAAGATYMTVEERKVIYILNLVRTNPALFAKTVLPKYVGPADLTEVDRTTFYYQSLKDTLSTLLPLNLLYPNVICFESAKCHAITAGQAGYVGHDRKTVKCGSNKYYYGECCDYGRKDALDIVISLLVDEDIPSLGHRIVCLTNFTKLGVSIQPHTRYGVNAVLDFYY